MRKQRLFLLATVAALAVAAWLNVQPGHSQIIGGGTQVIGGGGGTDIRHSFPPAIYAAVGQECNLYFENCLRSRKLKAGDFCVAPSTTAKGELQNERWTYTPVDGDVTSGTTKEETLTVKGYEEQQLVVSKDTLLRIAKSTAGPPGVPPPNLITNGTFATDLTGWSNDIADTFERGTNDGSQATYCRVVKTGGYGAAWQTVNLAAGTTYTLKFYMRVVANTGATYPGVGLFYSGGSSTALQPGGSPQSTWGAYRTALNITSSSWAEYTVYFQTPANGVDSWGATKDVKFRFIVESGTNSEIRIADVRLYAGTGADVEGTRQVLFLGDSTGSGPLAELKRLMTADTAYGLTLVGTSDADSVIDSVSTQNDCYHEYVGSWYYLTSEDNFPFGTPRANPFRYQSAFDFGHYLTASGITFSADDWVIIHLGINDILTAGNYETAPWDANLTNIAAYMNTVIGGTGEGIIAKSIRADAPTVRIGICLPIPPADQDAMGANYNAAYPRLKYRARMEAYREWLIANYGGLESSANIYLIPYHCGLDTKNNMISATGGNANARSSFRWLTSTAYVLGSRVVSSSKDYICVEAHTSGTFATDLAAGKWIQAPPQITRQGNGLHPHYSGYFQMADVLYSFLKYHE